MSDNMKPNRLIHEKSPYLLQHAHNPVDWYPWGDEAFEEAKKRDVPVFLSIGYSSCHWCHVMEAESFEDREVADILNKHFVSIKVDREERTDIDHLYMEACMALTGSGGWPLSLFLDHERQPFFAGTYFPKDNRYGMSGFITLLTRISSVWDGNREGIGEAASQLIGHLGKDRYDRKLPDDAAVKVAYKQMGQLYDQVHGGFSSAPKFPSVENLLFLLRYDVLFGDAFAREMVDKTLNSMATGGIFDHVGGGYFRYSTDNKWLVPHFEKMLYDNALLLMVYAEAACSVDKKYRQVAEKIAGYLFREMLDAEGGFYAAQDADSEGVEGKYYLWTIAEVVSVLGEKEGSAFCKDYNIVPEGNFEQSNIPNRIGDCLIADDERLGRILEHRKNRVPPLKDDKILASSNGLMIAALAVAGRLLDEPDWLAKGEKVAQFVLDNLFIDGRLMSSWREGVAKHPATLDDHAYLLWGLSELYLATFQPRWLKETIKLAENILTLFDDLEGGLYLSGKDVTDLPVRQKDFRDNVLPSGNAVTALVFSRLALISEDKRLEEAAQGIIQTAWSKLADAPIYYLGILSAWLFRENSVNIIISNGKGLPEMLEQLRKYHPFVNSAVCGEGYEDANSLIAAAREKKAVNGNATAYVCDCKGCHPPLTDMVELEKLLDNNTSF